MLSSHSVGTYQIQEMVIHSSQLAEPLRIDPGLKSGICVRKLISNQKKKKKSAGTESFIEPFQAMNNGKTNN